MVRKRQKIRKGLILLSFLFFPVTIYYLSPVIIVMGAAKGVVTGSFIIFFLLFASALFLGRSFCGWVCPAAGIQEACFSACDRRITKGNWIKYAIWVPWVATIALFALGAGGLARIDPLFQIDHGISVSGPSDYIIFFSVFFLIVIPAFAVGRRSFCHHICWMAPFMVIGRQVRNIFLWPSLRLVSDPEGCVHCHRCTENCPMSLEVEEMVAKGKMENYECILCGTCVDGCQQGAVRYTFGSGK